MTSARPVTNKAVDERPVRLIVSDDLRRGHGSVLFRFWFAIPFFVWLALWTVAAFFVAIANWLATLVRGVSPSGLHRFLTRYVRYVIHVYAYLDLAAERMPAFDGKPGYAIDLHVDEPRPQNRWTVAFRLVLALPALLLASILVGSSLYLARTGTFSNDIGLTSTAAFLAWFVGVARARTPRGLRDLVAYGLFYGAQFWAYLLLLTDRYPNSDPQTALPELPTRSDPIELDVRGEPARNRLTVFFRLILAIPHLIWLTLWSIAALIAAVANWFVTLAGAISPPSLHNFLAAFLRYQQHVYAYLFLIADPFPGFTGRPGSYPIEPTIAPPATQNRWTVGFRIVLAIPAVLLGGAYGGLLLVVAVLGWFAALATGRMPRGLRNAGALAIRYSAQASGYYLLLTDAYPYSGPIAARGAEFATPIPAPITEPGL
jgi:Domain of unknown function (DUF4389)